MIIRFIDKDVMEEEVGWLHKNEETGIWETVTLFKECLRVNSRTLEIEQANGFSELIGRFLCEGKVKIKKD